MATTAIAILNFNGKSFLQKFLPNLIQHSNNVPIYIGDNASTDDSVALIKADFPSVELIELSKNYGYSKGYNLLIKEIEADYIALVNSDIEVTANWLTLLIDQLDDNPNIAAVQPKIKSYHNKDFFEYAGAAGGFVDKYGYPFCRGRLFNTLEKDEQQYDDIIPIKWASGACFVIRKDAFDNVGGFDDDFFAHMEEIDLCWRFFTNGYLIKYMPTSTVYHVGGGTLAYNSPFKTYLNFRNGLFLLIKNLPSKILFKKLFARVLLDWLSIVYFLFQGKFNLVKAILKAHIEVLRNRKKFYAKRNTDTSSEIFTENYSVVWKYFVEGKKKFDQL